jgi:spore coat polysaccharide biosynthesis protein SpsF (cytidylyltransferase family)
MKTVFIALLLVAVVLGARTTSSKLQQKRISELAETRLGKTLLNLITLHSAVAGPV